MSLEMIMREERRLAMLKLLAKAPGRSANAYVIARSLPQLGHGCTLDQVKTDLAWLAEQGLIKSEDLGGGMVVATLLNRGDEAQAGLASIPGVAVPLAGT